MKNVRFITLGCRVNQYETQGMRENLEQNGVRSLQPNRTSSDTDVDFVVINTCTVTAKADRENKYWIRRARREHPRARIVVTGCGVVRDRETIENLPEVDSVLANHDKAEIASHLDLGCASPAMQDEPTRKRQSYTPLSISESEGKTRAFVKVQDGCNHACSFCKVVLVRGRSRSREMVDIIDEVKRLRDAGYRDVVFAGIQLGAFGYDLEEGNARIVDILEACSLIEGIDRLRLSSIEPTDVQPELIEALSRLDKCAHHLHIPLQSGDSEVLKGMNRRYGREFYLDLVTRLREAMPDFALTLDVMAGFPGEEEHHFENTVDLLKKVRPLKCHVFPYSRREGTRAARLPTKEVKEQVKRERVRLLIELGDQLGTDFRSNFVGQVMPVLVEQSRMREAHSHLTTHQGLTENFMKVVFEDDMTTVGQIVPVRLMQVEKDYLVGSIAEKEWLENMKGAARGKID